MPLAPATHSSWPKKLQRNLRWWILTWLVLAATINYMDRSALSVAASYMINDLGLTRTDIGLLGTIFSFAYALCQLPAGWLIDRLGARTMYAIGVIGWSISTALMGLGNRLLEFGLFRIFLGMFESPASPAASKITTEWFPPKERTQASGIWDSGSRWGPAIAPPLLTVIILASGWRAMFTALGIAGIVLGLAFLIGYKSLDAETRISLEERAFIREGQTAATQPSSTVKWGRLFLLPQTYVMIMGFFAIVWTTNIYVTFLPLYLHDVYKLDSAAVGGLAAVPWVVAALGGILGGYLMKVAARRRTDLAPLAVKKRAAMICAGSTAACTALVPFAPNLTLTITLMSFSLAFIAALSAAAWSIPGDIVAPSNVASLGSIQNFGGWFAGAISPLVTGMIVDATGSYAPPFIIGAVIATIAVACYGFFLKSPPLAAHQSQPRSADAAMETIEL